MNEDVMNATEFMQNLMDDPNERAVIEQKMKEAIEMYGAADLCVIKVGKTFTYEVRPPSEKNAN